MTGLLGPSGQPISSKQFQNKKAPAPALGERFGQWAGEEVRLMTLPGGGALAFDLSRLTLADYRQMIGNYQINSSLSLLTFMMHQMEWHIECDNKKIAASVEENLRDVWSRLVRAKSQALWAGYSPNALQWENDVNGRRIELTKIKDLIPEDCTVNWKRVKGKASAPSSTPPTFKVYDGIHQHGAPDIPVANSYWYPLLMQNGNYYGQQLLKSAFQPWFFSNLMHLFANRYFERFGEPVPVGRAPFEDEISVNGTPMKGNMLMAQIIQALRNRTAAVLPNDKTQWGDETVLDYDYQIDYLESQMRGADFERYMVRLDEEMSLALFTPILMMRTADVGSYNLGTQHVQTYRMMLNAMSGDWSHYINKYIVRPMRAYNFGENAPRAQIKFVRMGKVSQELLQAVMTELTKEGKVKYSVAELGEQIGMTVEEVQIVTGQDPNAAPATDPAKKKDAKPAQSVYETGDAISQRISQQVAKAYRDGTFGATFSPSLGYRRQFEENLRAEDVSDAAAVAADFYDDMDRWLKNTVSLGPEEFRGPDQFMRFFDQELRNAIARSVR